jgi:hypothetical protein
MTRKSSPRGVTTAAWSRPPRHAITPHLAIVAAVIFRNHRRSPIEVGHSLE